MKANDFQKYLRRNPAVPVFPPLPEGVSRCVVIPACDELETLPETLTSLVNAGNRNPVLIVINYPAGASRAVMESAVELRRRLEAGVLPGAEHLHWIYAPDLSDGVGEARKLGMDCFAAVHTAESAESAWIFSLDADSPVTAEYFEGCERCFAEHAECGVLIVPIRHRRGATLELEIAIRRYERYLRRHVEKLRYAGSPYAFQTIGSGFAVRLESYLRSGGMRKRRGGEDFYFLQAAAKVTQVQTAPGTWVNPSARVSERVPFGTGPALAKLLRGEALPEVSDHAFELLRQLLEVMPAGEPPAEALPFLEREKFYSTWERIRKNTPPGKEQAAFHCWFDGLKTLRFLHFIDSGTSGCAEAESMKE